MDDSFSPLGAANFVKRRWVRDNVKIPGCAQARDKIHAVNVQDQFVGRIDIWI